MGTAVWLNLGSRGPAGVGPALGTSQVSEELAPQGRGAPRVAEGRPAPLQPHLGRVASSDRGVLREKGAQGAEPSRA